MPRPPGIRKQVDHRQIIEILMSRADIFTMLGQGERALSDLERGLAMARASENRRSEAECLSRICAVHLSINNYQQLVQWANLSLDICQRYELQDLTANSLNFLGLAYYNLGDNAMAEKQTLEAMRIQEKIGDRPGLAESHNNIGLIMSRNGEYENSLEQYTRAYNIFNELGNRKNAALCLNNIGMTYSLMVDYEKSATFVQRALATQKEIGDVVNQALSFHNLGYIKCCQGICDESLAYFEQSLRLFRMIGDAACEPWVLAHMGRVLVEGRQFDKALAVLNKGAEAAKTADDDEIKGRIESLLGEIALSQGRPEEAAVHAEKMLSTASHVISRTTKAAGLMLRARAAATKGSFDDGERDFLQAIGEIDAKRDRLESAMASMLYAEYLISRERKAEALPLLSQAKNIFRRAGNQQQLLRIANLESLVQQNGR